MNLTCSQLLQHFLVLHWPLQSEAATSRKEFLDALSDFVLAINLGGVAVLNVQYRFKKNGSVIAFQEEKKNKTQGMLTVKGFSAFSRYCFGVIFSPSMMSSSEKSRSSQRNFGKNDVRESASYSKFKRIDNSGLNVNCTERT
jgi:hypothetical protein